jgi:hypothetical protein
MPVLENPNSEYNKELAKWNAPRPKTLFPQMLYKAQRTPGSGKWATSMEAPSRFGFPDDVSWDRACQEAVRFAETCQRIVQDETERSRAMEDGWRPSPSLAVEAMQEKDKVIGDEAAQRAYRDRNMSEKAQAEVEQFEASSFGHQPEIPEKKKRAQRSA